MTRTFEKKADSKKKLGKLHGMHDQIFQLKSKIILLTWMNIQLVYLLQRSLSGLQWYNLRAYCFRPGSLDSSTRPAKEVISEHFVYSAQR